MNRENLEQTISQLKKQILNIGRSLWLRCQKSKSKRTN